MSRIDNALARLSGRPYRSTADTTLEVMLRRGPLAPIKTPFPVVPVAFGVLATLASLVSVGLAMTAVRAGAACLLGAALWKLRSWSGTIAPVGDLPQLRARLANYPIPITGHVARWLDDGLLRLGRLDLVLREHHPLAEATVRLAEPDARLSWTSAAVLRVEPPWCRDQTDLPRLDRLVLLLGMYRDELGIETIELAPPDRDHTRSANAGSKTSGSFTPGPK